MNSPNVHIESDPVLESNFISRDISWLRFNRRVLDQAKKENRTILERLKFLAITASNLDEFFMIRVGSLYNYIDYNRLRVDYSGLREQPFKTRLLEEVQSFSNEQSTFFENELLPQFAKHGFHLETVDSLSESETRKVVYYFSKTIYPMLTPMLFDGFHTFPHLMNKVLVFGVKTKCTDTKEAFRFSFVQMPQNLPRFFEIERGDQIVFVSIEDIVRKYIHKLYKNIEVVSVSLFRLTRNGDFNYDDYDESELDFVEEIQKKLKGRKTGRVVRLEALENSSKTMLNLLKEKFDIEEDNIVYIPRLIDFTCLWQIVKHKEFKKYLPKPISPVKPLFVDEGLTNNIQDYLLENDVFLHHPYNSFEHVVNLIEKSADDPNVLAIKITIYRLAKDSRITKALLKAAETGKHVSVLFEVKARFDEENNIKEGQRLQKAGCFVIFGVGHVKTHTKLLMIVRKHQNKVIRYVHMSSGNYNEETANFYTDTGLLTTQRVYGNDVSEFFNVITGHSVPAMYRKLITTPGDMRKKIITLIRKEASNAKQGLPSGIVIKVNSLEDRYVIDELYNASRAGVKIKLIVRGICCLRPQRAGVSDNITVKSLVGDYLEHSRIYYFHNGGTPKVFGGSADIMVRSFDRRIESLFAFEDKAKMQAISILEYSLRDESNSYLLKEDGTYEAAPLSEVPFDIHKEFYNVTEEIVLSAKLF